jgi:hypothetical protein
MPGLQQRYRIGSRMQGQPWSSSVLVQQPRAVLDAIRDKAKSDNRVDVSKFVGNPNKGLSIRKSHILTCFAYRRAGRQQSNRILVDATSRRDALSAAETVLGPIDDLKPAKVTPSRTLDRRTAV